MGASPLVGTNPLVAAEGDACFSAAGATAGRNRGAMERLLAGKQVGMYPEVKNSSWVISCIVGRVIGSGRNILTIRLWAMGPTFEGM